MKNLYKALSNFQQECPPILKETEGYGYTYSDLPTIYETIMPLLKKNGIGFTQILRDDGIETIIFHIESGEELKGFTKIPQGVSLAKMNSYQVMGSAYTYYRRYTLSAMLGIITEKDTDATDANDTAPKTAPNAPRSPIQRQNTAGVPNCSICGKAMKPTKSGAKNPFWCKHGTDWGKPVYPKSPVSKEVEEFNKLFEDEPPYNGEG